MSELATSHGTLWVRQFGSGSPRMVALHGFTLHGGMYQRLAQLLGETVVAPDLPGHGRSHIEPVAMGSTVDAIAALLTTLETPLLLGYSQGGRVALQVALTYPNLISGLALVSTSAGLRERDRIKRRVADDALASRIERIGLERFITEWLATPLVATDVVDATTRDADRAIRLGNTAEGIAAALRGLGQASVSDSSHRIPELKMPVVFIAGERDERYAQLAAEMAASRR